MKKIISMILALAVCLSLCACGHTHAFGEWTVTAEPDCKTEGMKERICECGEKETEAITASGHTFGEVTPIVEQTCTQDGQEEKTCIVCGETVVENLTATGHNFKAATAFKPKTCSNCGLTEGEALAKVITVGDFVESEDHKFTVQKIEFTGALKEKRGNVTYNHSSDYALAIKLEFTNLATEAFERWRSDRVSDVSLEYMGKYGYEGECWVPVDDIVPLGTDTIYIVFEVPESMGKDTTGSIFATFEIDGETYAVIVQEGEGAAESEDDAPAADDVAGDIAVGDVRTNNSSFSFEMADLYYTEKPSLKVGNITYSFGTGEYYMVCKLDFTNLGTEAMEDWNSDRITDMSLVYSDKYTYEGRAWIPEGDIVPLGNGWVFILFEVSKEVENGSGSLVATFTIDDCEFTLNCR